MKKAYEQFVILCFGIVIVYVCSIFGYRNYIKHDQDQDYHLEMNDIVCKWQKTKKLPVDLGEYEYIQEVSIIPLKDMNKMYIEGDEQTSFWGSYDDQGRLQAFLCFRYRDSKREMLFAMLMVISVISTIIFLGAVLSYNYWHFIRPIVRMETFSEQIGKGNITTAISELPQSHFKRLRWAFKMLEDELDAMTKKNLILEKQRQTLITAMAHGIKTPVANIILYTSAIREKLYSQEKLPEISIKIEENASKIHKLLEELLQATSKPIYEIKIEKQEFYLEKWLEMICSNYKETLALQHITFEIESCPNCLIYSDPNALINVVSNLLDNAIKYGDGKYIRIIVEAQEGMLYVIIENSGVAIQKSEVNSIFKSFYRGSNAEKIQGNGLGLYICKSIMKELNGIIYVKSKGEVNQFIFAIPMNEKA